MLDSVTYCYTPRGSDIIFQTSSFRATSYTSCPCRRYFNVSRAYNQLVQIRPIPIHQKICYLPYRAHNVFKGTPLSSYSIAGREEFSCFNSRWVRKVRLRLCAALDVASAVDVINDLGLDTLTFLAVTVLVVPAFKMIKASPILGFFFAGVVLNQLGLIRNLIDVKVLSEWGILFLLFEMGLELSLARLKALAKFAFGMGLSQVHLAKYV
ncbi:unnamed protein product [Fraxinus pennsylvanica]|uniref:Cation/H+ exchanger transmembrane domain-containing protein n=1 Tax=Fraxinus pennsylvanica TaxID=56036 RepID=A0AAD2AG47_9LAMI|nr:unnamed protein product [Fraxinus pennsylvanica]